MEFCHCERASRLCAEDVTLWEGGLCHSDRILRMRNPPSLFFANFRPLLEEESRVESFVRKIQDCLFARICRFASDFAKQGFQASTGWLRWWKTRMHVTFLCGTNESQHVPADYRDQLIALRKEHYSPQRAKWLSKTL